MAQWDFEAFQEIITDKIDFSVLIGKPLAGKTTLCKLLEKHCDFKVVDMKSLEEVVRKRLGTEDEPFEGDVPIPEIEKEIVNNF